MVVLDIDVEVEFRISLSLSQSIQSRRDESNQHRENTLLTHHIRVHGIRCLRNQLQDQSKHH